MAEGIKKEFRIDSSDSAKPPATLQDEPRYFSDIKPKKRHISDIVFEETGEVTQTRKGKQVKLISKVVVLNDGATVNTTVGEDNEEYQEFIRTGKVKTEAPEETTLVRPQSDAVKAAIAKTQKTESKTRTPKKPAASKE